MRVLFNVAAAINGSRCAPPIGSGIIRSMIFCSSKSFAVSFSASAACSLNSQLRQRMLEHDSGEITEYHEFSSIITLSPIPIPSAPPDAPSPMTTTMIGTGKWDISKRLRAIASPCPRSSAPSPGYAPGVSRSVMIGFPNFAASSIRRSAFLYPSGFGIPKFR